MVLNIMPNMVLIMLLIEIIDILCQVFGVRDGDSDNDMDMDMDTTKSLGIKGTLKLNNLFIIYYSLFNYLFIFLIIFHPIYSKFIFSI